MENSEFAVARGQPPKMVQRLAELLQQNSFVVWLNGNPYAAVAIEAVHYFSMFVLVGSITILDLQILGVSGRRHNSTQLADRLFPGVWAAVTLNSLSGLLMFAGQAVSYVFTSIFQLKVAVVLLALLFAVIVQRAVPKWDQMPATPLEARIVAFVSLILWVAAVIAGVQVPAISGIG
jgi:hypothetical protein